MAYNSIPSKNISLKNKKENKKWNLLATKTENLSGSKSKQSGLCVFRAAPVAYWGSQAMGPIEAVATSLRHSHSNVGSNPMTYTTAHGNAWSLTHWVRLGIEPPFSWLLVGFSNRWATVGTAVSMFLSMADNSYNCKHDVNIRRQGRMKYFLKRSPLCQEKN